MRPQFCRDCRWHSVHYPEGADICEAEIYNLVTGEIATASGSYTLCSIMRRPDMPCGLDGRLFERRPFKD